MIPLL